MASFSTARIFGFATAVCVVCSVSVASVSMSLRDLQDLNKERDLRVNILDALGLPENGGELEGEAIDEMWEERVEQRFITADGSPADEGDDQDGDGDLDADDVVKALEDYEGQSEEAQEGDAPDVLGVYVRMDKGSVAGVAIPMDGNGLWGPLSGYLALDPAGEKVTGATFFAPKETPGLGAEIMELPFKSQFKDKRVVDDAGKSKTIRVVKGQCTEKTAYCVDGVSGATITSRGVDEMVAEALEWYDPYLRTPGG
ncbi:MAG: NADH:ubiquinone reductase (Na(+)-transporting) subunit C [Myxococcales bacterium]|nr:NADH:ubiquinone reductase (Na(+)-transporting) subunit C [Myxococcales bacterium]